MWDRQKRCALFLPPQFNRYAQKKRIEMELNLMAAGITAFIVGLFHTILGEFLIFKRMRNGSIIPTQGHTLLKERHVRIIWASWHIVTIFGWSFGAVLINLSISSSAATSTHFILSAIIISMTISALLVLFSTKAKHPGWVGLLAIAIFTLIGTSSY